MKFIPNIWSKKPVDHLLFVRLKKILGYTPSNKDVYIAAIKNSSMNIKDTKGIPLNFERLEYLGDSILSAIVARYLFEELPSANEGELTRMKSKIVSRDKLNLIGKEMDLVDLLVCTVGFVLFSF